MPHVGGQKYKILNEYQILMNESDEQHQINAIEMTRRLEARGISAERKTVYKDMATLMEAGVDVVKGDKGYYIGSRVFELAELKLLVDAVGASKFISQKKTKELVEKITTLASMDEATQLTRQVVVPEKRSTGNEKIFYSIDVIYQCLDNNKKMSFKYQDWTLTKEMKPRHGGKIYVVSPAFLLRNDENYYLVAYDDDSQQIRHYRVDKIISAEMLEEERSGDKQRGALNPHEYAKQHISMFAGDERVVTIRFDKRLIGVVLDKFGADIDIRAEGEDLVRARISVAVSPQLYGWLTGIGATICFPEEEERKFKDYIKAIIDK
ncbi:MULTISPECIES: helix-turn-helix transcriptional regulator [Pseudobutyrivibrio]|uniref:Predicted DNA-binding transcriptional regulator YafY, contains an HTH and WYL domains n=1 Tax=Pseudobutyrivibrio ruminis TaxID=46206 RepID=A0A1H7M5Y6_9FIRM|nr:MULTISPECIES: WYL domain-containing protein [Pseudobutyrivibrio]MBE5914680.1 WYL domain-containing protein [Pseudobutyrivibrio ruminis]SEL06624.1 Predicted DNA-binding transcriptional regulator YafY, contains an HTH and WYL domains [Pseudobutyrivibrio ruminis]SET41490.1 Predicted DNA-binding transcriptional regulator YafY, contains an HTH and WYL domains [Pseudobutyrivibrio sp. C4]SFO53398.1 Predicted DNA-binding transcriptional regulator YafY, contains an HTH and WYL domains [Pseudobutyrivi